MADVESANTVGYDTATAPKNSFIAVGVQFVDPLTDAVRTVAISNLVETTNPRTGNAMNNNVDQIHVWTGNAWRKYYNKTGVGYVLNGAADTSKATSDTVSVGDCVFFRKGNHKDGGEAKICGAIYSGDTVEYSLPKNAFTFVAYPWPVDFSIAKFAEIISNPRAGAAMNNNVDQIHVWTGNAWRKYYNKNGVGYVENGAADTSKATEDSIEPGVGVFIRKGNHKDGGTVTFTKPAFL